MAAADHRFWRSWTTICVFAFCIYGLIVSALPQQSGPEQVFPSLLDGLPQQQPQPQPPPLPLPQPQPQQQLPPPPPPQQQSLIPKDTIDHQSTAPIESANANMAPVDLNICSDANYRSVDTLPGLRRSTEVRTLQLGQAGVIWPMGNRTIPFNTDCVLQLSACSACQILISWNAPSTDIRSLSAADPSQPLPVDRDNRLISCENIWDFRDRARCIDLRLIETDADQTTLKPYQKLSLLNPPAEYRTQFISSSYKLDLNLQFWRGDVERANGLRQLFPLKYMVVDNTRTIRGRPSPADLPTNYSDGFIASPRFPKTYPEGVTVNYTLINEDPEGTVRLIFTDFRLHYMSILKIIDSNGQEIANTQSQYGTSQRPSAIQSSGHTLTVIFTANNYKHEIGFRANYRFVKEKTWLEQPSPKSCDKVFEDTGGTITIENLNLDAFTYVDCIWILEKPRYAPIGFDKLYLKVEDFSVNSGGKGVQLDVHVGRTSMNRRLLTIFGPKSSEQLAREQPQEGFISDSVLQAASENRATTTMEEEDSDTGFYLRLRGFLGSSTGMDIAFAQFYRWATAICHDGNEFHCDNGRCISNRYQCDSHDHCGDFSDELKCQNRKSEHGSKGRSGIYAGPGGEEYEGSSLPLGGYTTTILLVAGLIGLTLVLLMVTIIVARVYRQKLIRRFAASAAVNVAGDGGGHSDDAIGAMSTSNSINSAMNRSSSAGLVISMDDQLGSRPAPSLHQVGNRRLLVLPESEIGVLEAPPTYDDALKHPTVPPSAAATLLRASQQLNTPGSGTSPSAIATGSGQAMGIVASIAPSSAGPSNDAVSTSFDNPAFDSGMDVLNGGVHGALEGRRLRRNRRRDRSRSGESTCSSVSSSASDISDSCTASDLETASDNETGNPSVPPLNTEVGSAKAARTAGVDDNSHQTPTSLTPRIETAEPGPAVDPVDAISQPSQSGFRKPPVPLPRSSRMARFAAPSQGQLQLAADAGSGSESLSTGTEVPVSSRQRLNDTLV